MRRTKKDLEYLVDTTTENGTKDTALFGEREDRLVDHGWRETRFGETTSEGCDLAKALRQYADEKFKWDLNEDEYPERIRKHASRKGTKKLLKEIGFE